MEVECHWSKLVEDCTLDIETPIFVFETMKSVSMFSWFLVILVSEQPSQAVFAEFEVL